MGRVEHSFRERRRCEWMERRAQTPVTQGAIDGVRAEGIPTPARSVPGYVRPSESSSERKIRAGEQENSLPGRIPVPPKESSEGWADFAGDLQSLAYPSLQHKVREWLAINAYLHQLRQPQVAFGLNVTVGRWACS